MLRVRHAICFISILVLLGLTADAFAIEMRAGVAKVKLTNMEPRVMVNGRVSDGVKEDLYGRVLVLNDGENRLVIITYDYNCLDVGTPYLRVYLRDELRIPPSHLILLATHNHNAPIQINPDNFDYGEWIADEMFKAVKKAIANEVGPVQLQFGSGHGYFIYSRGNAPTDFEIQVLKVVHNGEPIALLFNHGTHPAQASVSKVDAGHPGYAMDEIEAAIPGVLALYGDACGGNQYVRRPLDHDERIRNARQGGPEAIDAYLEETARELGHELAERVLAIANGPMEDVTGPIESRLEVVDLPLGDPISRETAEKLIEDVPKDVGFVPYPHPHRGTNWVRMLLYWYDKGLPFPKSTTEMICTDDTYLIHTSDREMLSKYDYAIHDQFPCVYEEVIVSRVGPMAFVAMQGEICAPIGMRIKDQFRYDMPIMVFGYMGEHNLYIPTRELVRLNAYQDRVIQIQYASPVPWDPEVEDVMVNSVIKMVSQTMDYDPERRYPR